jgi:hypothetical protein
VSKGGAQTGLISRYYVRDLMEKTHKKHAKFSVEEVFSSKELVGFLYGKSLSNPKVYKDDVATNLERVCSIGGSSCVWAPASNFPIYVADSIIEKYNKNNIVYDFSCGWGNRLLSALRNNVTYLGTDPNYVLVQRLKQICTDYSEATKQKTSIDIRAHGSEELVGDWIGTVGLAFSSPPYYDEEDYIIGNQSYKPGVSYQEWLDGYLRKTIENIYQYLIPDGVFCINVKNIRKYALEHDTREIAESCGFEMFGTEILKNNLRCHPNLGLVDNSEKIMCFKKSQRH